MRETLAKPYIEDVLAGAGEWRMMGPQRTGQLLTESFARKFEAAGMVTGALPRMRRRVREVTDVGLVFNAGLCGQDDGSGSRGNSERGGGVAAITNMSADFERAGAERVWGWNLRLPVERVTRPNVTLFRAASLSANFPPVFANAALDTDVGGRRLWVTDGGAVENRGVLALLLALSDALEKLNGSTAPIALPRIRLVVAEASALDEHYKSDRGLGAKFGAATQIANGLTNALLQRVNDQYRRLARRPGDIQLVYLPMPDALRAAGTFGTHWMMPPRVPLGAALPRQQNKQVQLESGVVIELIDALFRPDFSPAYVRATWPGLDFEEVTGRLAQGWEERTPWQTLYEGLAARSPASAQAP
jgi:hypothetical protein